jgi:HEAT repeat
MPEYVELLLDEEPVVREAAVESILGLLEFLDAETRSVTIVPMWKKLCEDKSGRMPYLIAKTFGQFMFFARSI